MMDTIKWAVVGLSTYAAWMVLVIAGWSAFIWAAANIVKWVWVR